MWRGSSRSGCWKSRRAIRSCWNSPTVMPPTRNGSASSWTRRMRRGGRPGACRPVLEVSWTDLWRRLSRAGELPDLNHGLMSLAAAGLVMIQPGTPRAAEEYPIHPAVAAAGRDLAGHRFQEAVDTALAVYWASLSDQARDREVQQETSEFVIRAGLSAAPYLLRLHAWEIAAQMLEHVLTRDGSRAAAHAALPALRTVVAAVAGTD